MNAGQKCLIVPFSIKSLKGPIHLFLIVILLLFQAYNVCAQRSPKWDIGAYYGFISNRETRLPGGGPPSRMDIHHLNFFLRYHVHKRVRIDTEYNTYHVTGSDRFENPYKLYGIHSDFIVWQTKYFKISARMGVSGGEMLFFNVKNVYHHWRYNVVIGSAFDLRILPSIYLQVAGYMHVPLKNHFELVEATHPAIGTYVHF